jgi:pyruvate/2-oxoglutarate dehydrogenase complex dihydrolipoamide dehydrogenase (E3) component
LGQAFTRLGATVTLIEALPRLLAREDPRAAALVHDALVADGVEVLTGHRLTSVTGGPGRPGTLTVESESGTRDIDYDTLLVAVGRTPGSRGLGLERAGVEVDPRGFVVVDDLLRTSNKRIWAAGDITGLPQFTHMAGVGASLAASNAVLGLRRKVDLSAVPRVTYTDPEVAAVGAASWADGADEHPRTVTRDHADVDRAVTEGRTDGFSTLVLGGRRRVIGGTIVGPRAGESLAEVVLAVRQGLTISDLAGTIHAYPTYSDGVWNAATSDVQARLAAPRARATTERLVRLRRAWLARRAPAGSADHNR